MHSPPRPRRRASHFGDTVHRSVTEMGERRRPSAAREQPTPLPLPGARARWREVERRSGAPWGGRIRAEMLAPSRRPDHTPLQGERVRLEPLDAARHAEALWAAAHGPDADPRLWDF